MDGVLQKELPALLLVDNSSNPRLASYQLVMHPLEQHVLQTSSRFGFRVEHLQQNASEKIFIQSASVEKRGTNQNGTMRPKTTSSHLRVRSYLCNPSLDHQALFGRYQNYHVSLYAGRYRRLRSVLCGGCPRPAESVSVAFVPPYPSMACRSSVRRHKFFPNCKRSCPN